MVLDNTFCYGLLNIDEKATVDKIGPSGFEFFYGNRWEQSHNFNNDLTYRRKQMSESEIITFLENSTTAPIEWPEQVLVYAKKLKGCWEYKNRGSDNWTSCNDIFFGLNDVCYLSKHRLKKKVMSESEIITFLENSTTAPIEWPKEVLDYAIKIQDYGKQHDKWLFEYFDSGWDATQSILKFNDNPSRFIHRLIKDVWPVKEYIDLSIEVNSNGFKVVAVDIHGKVFISNVLSHERFVCYLDENKQECDAKKAKYVRVINA